MIDEIVKLVSSFKEVGNIIVYKNGKISCFFTEKEFPDKLKILLKDKYQNWNSYLIAKNKSKNNIWDLARC
jgi:hypothetical protein